MTAGQDPLWSGADGRKVRLRAVEPADRRTLAWFDRARDQGAGGYRHWAAHRANVDGSGDDVHLAIETLHGRMVVGSMWVLTDPPSGQFSYGIGIGAPHRRCGYAGDAISVLLAVMFWQRRYRRCEVSIDGGNFASLSLHSGLGFHEVGRRRDTEVRRGEIKYPALMAITAPEFAAHLPRVTAALGPVRPWRGRHWRARQRGRHWATEYLR